MIRAEVEAGAYVWGPFRRFLIHDPKEREIRAAPFRYRVLPHAIFDVLDPIFRRGFIAYAAERDCMEWEALRMERAEILALLRELTTAPRAPVRPSATSRPRLRKPLRLCLPAADLSVIETASA
ncbi:MAG: hypothetical protein IT294_16570 [Deltaproteobacteria bacterium]|nr:hypothetical protein [Deltaproteobacteria bacterium]